jgi:hypothetical protein
MYGLRMAAGTRKNFIFQEGDTARLSRLQDALGGTETDVLRWALVALEGTLDHGLSEWSFEGPDGKRGIALRRPPGLSLLLMENDQGGFTPWHMAHA